MNDKQFGESLWYSDLEGERYRKCGCRRIVISSTLKQMNEKHWKKIKQIEVFDSLPSYPLSFL